MSEKKEEIVKNRSEIAFFYDIRDCNPNGDPLAENRPRIDEETGQCYVTDVRLKRTIRDYLRDYKKETILIDDFEKDDGSIKTAKERAEDFGIKSGKGDPGSILLSNCIDARLFGCAIPLGEKQKSIQITGPVQFNYGRSVHEVEEVFIQGTAAFASKTGKDQRSFREDYILHYALIRFYGMLNENLGKISKCTETDFKKLIDAIWHGTESLQSRSKIGHLPRLLVVITYKDPNFMIGQIDKSIEVSKKNKDQPDKALRNINEFEFDFSKLIAKIKANKDKIDKVILKVHEDIVIKNNIKIADELGKLVKVETI